MVRPTFHARSCAGRSPARHSPHGTPRESGTPPAARRQKRFLAEYRSYLQIVLFIAGLFSLLILEWGTGLLLFVLTFINAIEGMREAGKAESAMNALKGMMKSHARVRRDGTEAQVAGEELVPGDVVLLAAGDQVPADGRIVSATTLQIDESALTGESVPAAKDVAATPAGKELGPGDQTDMAFMNTPVTHGSGVMIVTTTGGDTQVGRIAHMLSATKVEDTPLTKQLNRMTLWIVAVALVTMVVMFVLGAQRGESMDALFVTAIALAIAAVPEALPTVAEVILSMGAIELAKQNAIIKDLSSVETLGSTSAINSDKTGTLTMNQMTAVEVVNPSDRFTITGIGYSTDGKVQHTIGSASAIDELVLPYLVASDATLVDGKVVGDPTEGALLVMGAKAGIDIEGTRSRHERLATLPFDPTYKLMATFDRTVENGKEQIRVYVKGAVPAVLGRCTTALDGAGSVPVDAALTARMNEEMERLGGEGLRVMAAAQKDLDAASFDPDGDLLGVIEGLELRSLVGMIDPARDTSKPAVERAQAAHVRVRMVTGDDVITGAAIAKQLGIPGRAVLGEEFAALSEQERLRQIDDIGVVGRVAPQHKVLLVETLRAKGEVVAMTGDGVNDAPAIKSADIGIAMGTGTEVAMNAGRMILSDDNFATIILAVEQGRKLYDNLSKYVRFILVTLVTFVATFLVASILDIAAGQPFTPLQILWINFLIDTPLGIALGFDAESPDIMSRFPRPKKQSVLTRGLVVTATLVGLFMAAWLIALISLGINTYGGLAAGSSMALTAFAWFRIVCAWQCRSETGSAFGLQSFDNSQLNRIILIEVALAFLVTEMDVFHKYLGTASMNTEQWTLTLVAGVALYVAWEIGKLVARRVGAGAPVAAATAPAAPAQPATAG